MNILFISNYFKLFEESDSGASNRSNMFLRSLSQFANVDVISFTKVCDSNIPNCTVIYSEDITNKKEVRKKEPLKKIKDKAKKVIRLVPPYNFSDFYEVSKEKSELIKDFCKKKKYDFIACRYIDVAISCSLFKYADKLIIDVDDSPKQSMLVQINAYYSGKGSLENPFYKYFKSLYFKVMANAIDKVTKKLLSKVYCSFYSSPIEKPYSKSIYLHNVSMAHNKILDEKDIKEPIILMVGWFIYYPNINGALHFATKVFPIVRKAIPNIEFHIVGKSNNKEFINKMKSIDGVHVKGYVKNLDSEYEACNIVVVPLYDGSGTSVKVMEAMQMNRPVVSTPMGVRGLDKYLRNGIDYLRADNDNDFANNIINLLKSGLVKINQMANNGRNVVQSNFSQKKFMEIVKNTVLNND